MKLYSGPLSLFTAKVRVALAEKALAYERIEVGWSLTDRYIPHHPDVVRLNPKRQVPVLVDGDLSLYDSTIIMEYLEDRYPDPPLLPRGPAARARCRQLEAEADELIFEPIWSLIEESFYPAPPEGRDPARANEARAELAGHYTRLDALLEPGPYLCGNFAVADIGTFIMLNAAATLGAPVPVECARLAAWVDLVGARPAVADEVAAMQGFVADLLAAAAGSAAAGETAAAGA